MEHQTFQDVELPEIAVEEETLCLQHNSRGERRSERIRPCARKSGYSHRSLGLQSNRQETDGLSGEERFCARPERVKCSTKLIGERFLDNTTSQARTIAIDFLPESKDGLCCVVGHVERGRAGRWDALSIVDVEKERIG